MAKNKLPEFTMRDLIEAEQALEILLSRDMTGKVSYALGKILRKAKPEIRAFRDGIIEKIEAAGEGAIIREDNNIKLDPKHDEFEKNLKKVEKHRKSALEAGITLDGCITHSLEEVLNALPKRNTGTEEEPKWEQAMIAGIILSPLWWAITE